MSCRPSLAALLPIVLKASIEMGAAQRQDGVGSRDGPEHSRLFETRADHRLASSFNYTRANKQVLAAKFGITHPLCISFEVICLGANLLGHKGDCRRGWPAARPPVFRFSPCPAGASGGSSSKLSVGLPAGDTAGAPPPTDAGEHGRGRQSESRRGSVRRPESRSIRLHRR